MADDHLNALAKGCSDHAAQVGALMVCVAHNSVDQVVNEPSVGLYFIKEHVRKAVPFLSRHQVGW